MLLDHAEPVDPPGDMMHIANPNPLELERDHARVLHPDVSGLVFIVQEEQVILPTASAVSNEGRSSPLLVPLPAVSWPWVLAWGLLEPSRRGGQNAQKTGKNGAKMGEIRPKKCEGRELTKDQLAPAPRGRRFTLKTGRGVQEESKRKKYRCVCWVLGKGADARYGGTHSEICVRNKG